MDVKTNNSALPTPPSDGASPAEKPSDGRNTGVMTPEKLAAILAASQRLRDNPLFEEYIRAVEEYRRLNNTVPDSD